MAYQHKNDKDFIIRQPLVWYGEKPRSKLAHATHKHKSEKGQIMSY